MIRRLCRRRRGPSRELLVQQAYWRAVLEAQWVRLMAIAHGDDA